MFSRTAALPHEDMTPDVISLDFVLIRDADDSPMQDTMRVGTLCKLKMTLRGGDGYLKMVLNLH